jgi:nucleoside-diphosphate-sugar epimerase
MLPFALEKALKDKEAGEKTPSGMLYGASKTASDRAVWKFRDEHKVSSLSVKFLAMKAYVLTQ